MYKPGYYYLHVNGQIIWRRDIIVESDPQYFDSPLVVKYWKVTNESEYKKMITEAKDINKEAKDINEEDN